MPDAKDLQAITAEEETPKDTQIAKIEGDLEREKDARKEERFYWIFGGILLVDYFVFPNASSITGIICLTLLQLVLLITLAAWCGLDHVSVLLHDVLTRVMKALAKDEQKE